MKAEAYLLTYILKVVRGERTGFAAGFVLFCLEILEIIYCLLLKLTYFLTPRKQLPVPVVSVGNLTVGGTGKTPTVVWLVTILRSAGFRPAVLTRGYGGKFQKKGRLITNKTLTGLTAEETGDEPYLLARLLPETMIAVGRDRYRMGLAALAADPTIDVFVLDDGFQFFRLKRQLDLILLDAVDPFDNRHLLPRGLLREPLTALRRAEIVLLTRTQQVDPADLALLTATVKRYQPQALIARVWAVNSTVTPLADWGTGGAVTLAADRFLKQRRIGLVTAIGNPGQLQKAVQSLGAELVYFQAYPDHHLWNDAEVEELIAALKSARVNEVLITAKDAAKLITYQVNFQSNDVKCYILNLDFEIADPAVSARLQRACRKRG